jgi:glycerol kinase
VEGFKDAPIVAAIGDSHAALVAHGGMAKATYGTGSSLMVAVEIVPKKAGGLAATIAWSTPQQTVYALEGNISMAGAAVQWVGEFLGLAHPVEDALALAATVPDAGGVVLVPAMVGLGAPYWRTEARGLICGLERGSSRAQLARAAVDSIAFQVRDVFEAVCAATGSRPRELHADGGATRNKALMQMQADLLEVPVVRSACEDLSALGAGCLGGLALGWWKSVDEFAALGEAATVFTPGHCMETQYAAWQAAVDRTLQEVAR